MIEDRKAKAKRIADMEVKIAEFKILANTPSITEFVTVPSSVPEPVVPVKPNRPLLIAWPRCLSLGDGHRPGLPARAHRPLGEGAGACQPRSDLAAARRRAPDPPDRPDATGRHLWTPGASESLASDAYRNVRASLLGVADRRGPIVTLLVTSAKAGEGKSTTALNLAATCALAGERTLLLDIDFRRPSLAEVFIEDEDWKAGTWASWTSSAARSPGSVRSATRGFPTSTSSRPATRGRRRSRSSGTLELRQLLLALVAPLRPRHPRRAGGARPRRLPIPRPDRRCVAAGRAVGIASPDDSPPRQGHARAVACGDRGGRVQRADRGHGELVELWIWRRPRCLDRLEARCGSRKLVVRYAGTGSRVVAAERFSLGAGPR